MEELEEYIRFQMEQQAEHLAKLELEKTDLHTEYLQHKVQFNNGKKDLTQRYKALEAKYEEKCLGLLVAEVKLMFDIGSANPHLAEMRKELAAMQYKVSMGEEKVNQILRAHKCPMRELVIDSLDKGCVKTNVRKL